MHPRDLLYASTPTVPERFKKEIDERREEVLGVMRGLRAKIDHIKRSGHYSPKGEAIEIDAAIAATQKELAATRKIIDRINAVIKEEGDKALAPKQNNEDQMVRFQRLQAKRDLLEREAPLDPKTNQRDTLKLNVRLRQAVEKGQAEELIAALELFPEFPVAPPEFIEQFKRDIAERASPVSGDMAELRSAYTYLLGTANNELGTIAESLNVARYTSDEKPYLVSGNPLPEGILTGEPSAK